MFSKVFLVGTGLILDALSKATIERYAKRYEQANLNLVEINLLSFEYEFNSDLCSSISYNLISKSEQEQSSLAHRLIHDPSKLEDNNNSVIDSSEKEPDCINFILVDVFTNYQTKELDLYFSRFQNALIFSVNNIHYLFKESTLKFNTVFNYHDALLPLYRGANAFCWTIFNNEAESGITFHYVDQGLDTGPIILQEKVKLNGKETGLSLINTYLACAIKNLDKCLTILETQEQPPSIPLSKEDAERHVYRGNEFPLNNLLDLDCLPDYVTTERFLRATFGLAFFDLPNAKAKYQGEIFLIKSFSFKKLNDTQVFMMLKLQKPKGGAFVRFKVREQANKLNQNPIISFEHIFEC